MVLNFVGEGVLNFIFPEESNPAFTYCRFYFLM